MDVTPQLKKLLHERNIMNSQDKVTCSHAGIVDD